MPREKKLSEESKEDLALVRQRMQEILNNPESHSRDKVTAGRLLMRIALNDRESEDVSENNSLGEIEFPLFDEEEFKRRFAECADDA